jgi:hypothetical protein
MSIEHAKETLEHAEHEAAHGDHSDNTPRRVAILVAFLAAALALTELSEKASQNEYLTHHISLSDTFAFLQARNIRRDVANTAADVIETMPGLDDEGRKKIKALRENAQSQVDRPKTGDGSKQLLEKAKEETEAREHAFHRYHKFEFAAGALQISIVLASVSIITRIKTLSYMAAAIGLGAAVYAGLTAGGLT